MPADPASVEITSDDRPGIPPPLVVNGRWFIPALFIGLLVFTVGMCYVTIVLGHAMRPGLERYEVAREKAAMEKERAASAANSAKTP